ncbi:glycoside hydrolase family 17 protein [Trichocladium antarcticum]|uniref:Probable beta-glucosidase btgE n=1 Tax=Trichocladium antarcticum TaxID=1450529 RepID=A0AAN6ZAM9_9PEZI|nr:glycoside hydrolase family 17 protein [Trichocladium antarcticum]
MKAAIVAAAAAVLAGGASAARGHRHGHQALFEKRDVCVPTCTTIYSVITGEATTIRPPPKTSSSSSSIAVEPTTTPAPVEPTSSGPATVPTPIPQTCPTPGTYTFPATTIVVTETTTVCGGSVTTVPSGTHTLGGVTTVVTTATTVVCPVATTEVENGVVTSVIKTTTYVCPTAGTYTIAPITTHVPAVTTVVVPIVTTYCPGTYTAPAVVTTITETNVVVYCPFTSSEIPPPVATPEPTSPAIEQPPASPTPAPVSPTAAPPPPPPPPPAPPASSAAAPPPPPPPASTAASPPPASSSPAKHKPPTLGGNGKLWAMTYTPFRSDGQCKTAGEVMEDISAIAAAGFTTLRVYSTDCDTLTSVGPAARKHGLRMIVGIFIGKVGCDNGHPDVAEQISALKAWKQWDLVDLCVVANEALFNNFCTVSELTNLITHTKEELASVGYNGPFTTTDVVSAWTGNDVSSICAVIDVVATNAHAYFNSQTDPSNAGPFVAGQLAIVEKVCGKPGYVMETGWPKAGNCNGVACAGESQQRSAIESIQNELGNKVVFFSFRDDPWKQPGDCNCEQHWGCASVWGV